MMKIVKEKTFGYWFTYFRCQNTLFMLGSSKKVYSYVESVIEYFPKGETITIVIIREVGTINYKAIKYSDIENKEIKIVK